MSVHSGCSTPQIRKGARRLASRLGRARLGAVTPMTKRSAIAVLATLRPCPKPAKMPGLSRQARRWLCRREHQLDDSRRDHHCKAKEVHPRGASTGWGLTRQRLGLAGIGCRVEETARRARATRFPRGSTGRSTVRLTLAQSTAVPRLRPVRLRDHATPPPPPPTPLPPPTAPTPPPPSPAPPRLAAHPLHTSRRPLVVVCRIMGATTAMTTPTMPRNAPSRG